MTTRRRAALHRGAALVAMGALGALGATGLTACGTSTAAAHPSTTTTTTSQTLAQRYTAVVSAGDHRLQALSIQLSGANGNITQIQSGFRSVSATYHAVAQSVRALPFPAKMQGDVASMVAALGALSADATQGSQSVDTSEFNLVFTKLSTDQKAEVAANTTVNHDLGISAIN